ETSTSKVSLSTKSTESRWLAIANLPETATEETIKDCFKRHGRILSVKVDEQRFAFVAFTDVRAASKAHNAENILDQQHLRTAFHDGSNSVPKALLGPPTLPTQSSSSSIVLPEQPSPLTSSTVIDAPSSSSSNTSNITTVTNPLPSKIVNGDREKRPSRTLGSPDENVRHQVVPVKRDSDSSGSKRKSSSTSVSKVANSSHSTIQKPPRRKHDNSSSSSSSSSSSESERSSDDSVSVKNSRRNPTKSHSLLNESSMGKTKILKLYHLPPKMQRDALREAIWNLFVDFKKTRRLLTVKIDGEHEARYALLTFSKCEDVERALAFVTAKPLNGARLKAEPYDGITNENEECDIMKRSLCSDLDLDEYSVRATRTLYIGNLQSEISYNELRETYSAYGDIIELEIKRQTQTPHQLPFAFVQYADIKSVVKAMRSFDSKMNRDHSIKLGFGKSQPTNVLWLDDIPLNVTESTIRSFIIRQTSLATEQVLDIYIDNRNSHKTQAAQCLIYFADTRAAQEAINLIRGKKVDSKKIQVDFASKVFVTRFSDIIEETSHKKSYPAYPPDPTYHGESRSVSKRNGTVREIVPETIQPFDAASARTNSGDRWANTYNNSTRSQHKNESRHSSDRRHSKEYGKGTSSSLISIPSVDNGILPGSSLSTRRHRLSTSSKDSLSNNLSTGRNHRRSNHAHHHASSTSSSSSRSTASSSTHSSSSTNSVDHRSNSYQKHHSTKHSQKSSKKHSKSVTNNQKSSSKKSSSTKEQSHKSSHRSRSMKSEKDTDLANIIPSQQQQQQQQQQQTDLVILPSLTVEDQMDSLKKDSSPPKLEQTTTLPSSSSSPKAPLKNTERVFDWLMQNHHDSNSSMGLDQNDDDEHLLKRKPDDDSLENISDEQASKTSPPLRTNNLSSSAANLKSSTSSKSSKNEKYLSTSAYRLQPIRTGNKRDDQMDNSSMSELHLSPPPSTPTPQSASIQTPTSLPTPTPSNTITVKDEHETPTNHRRAPLAKYHLSTNHTKNIPLESIASYDQLDVRLKSYPSLFNEHVESIRLPFPQFAFEHIKTSTTASNVLVVLNPKAHLKHSSLGLNNPSSFNTAKNEISLETNLLSNNAMTSTTTATATTTTTTTTTTTATTTTNNNDDELLTTRMPLDERIRLLDKQMHEMNHGQQKSATSSSSSSSSSSLSPATLVEQQNQKSTLTTAATTTAVAAATANNSTATVKSVNELVSTLSATTSSATLAQCIQAVRTAALIAQPNQTISPSKTTPPLPTTSPFHFPVPPVTPLALSRTLSTVSPSPVHIPSVLTPPPHPPPFSNLPRLPDPSSNPLLNSFHAAIAQTQIAAKYSSIPFAAAIHPPPPPVPASLISPSLNLNSPLQSTTTPASTNNLIPSLSGPLPTHSPSFPNRSMPANLLSPPISNMSSLPSFPESPASTSPSTSSAKILERLGPSAKFKRKPIPPPLAVVTTPTTPTNVKDSPVLPSPESTTSANTPVNTHHSPVTSSSPVLQHQQSNTPSGLKSILKQRSLSNPSPSASSSPTNERKSSTNYVSPLAANETRSISQVTPTTNRSTSIDSTIKRTPPTTPTIATEKKKPSNQQDSSVFTNDIDERQASSSATADDKKSTWRTPPTKQTSSTEQTNSKKPTLDKIPKKSSATPKPPVVAEPAKPAAKASKIVKPTSVASLGTKVPQLTLERIDAKSVRSSTESQNKLPSAATSTTAKPIKLKRANVIQSDSDSEKKPIPSADAQKTKKSLLNNEITKRKQQHQQKPSPIVKKGQVVKAKGKTATPNMARKQSVAETHSSASDSEERRVEQTTTTTTSDQDHASSDDDRKPRKEPIQKRTKTVSKNKGKSTQNTNTLRELRQDTSMYDRIKKRARSEQTRNSSLSTSEDHLSDDDSNSDDSDDDDDDDDNKKSRRPNRSNNVTSRRLNVMSDSSDSEIEIRSKTKDKKATVFDNDIFDAEESDDDSKSANRKKKTVPPPAQPMKKPTLKTNNEQTKKEITSKNVEESQVAKKKISISKPIEKKKAPTFTPKPPTKTTKTTTTTSSAQKRPSTDESNESTKKLKLDDQKAKTTTATIEEQHSSTPPPPANQIESETSTPTTDKPSIVVTSPPNEPLKDTLTSETTAPATPTKFGIVFTSHHRHSTTTPLASLRKPSTETSTSHETSKNDDEEMEDGHESAPTTTEKPTDKEEQTTSNANTLKPPTAPTQSALSDDETLNPETMQLSDLIGGSRREEPTKSAQSRSGRATGKGKRATKQETLANKRQQTKANAKTVQSSAVNEKESLPPIPPALPTVEQPHPVSATAKRLSTAEVPSSSSSSATEKEAKRLRKSTDDLTMQTQIKLEPMENVSQWTSHTKIKEENIEPVVPLQIPKEELVVPPPSSSSSSIPDQSHITSMETEPVPPPSSIISSTQPLSTTSAETENAIKVLCPSIQIPQQTISKTANLEKSSPILAPISKETLPIVEHQPTSTATTSILPSHVSIKSSLTSATFNENVEETLSAVNSLLMLNNNPANLAADHPAMKGTARVTPTISKPVYSFVASLPSPTDQKSRQPQPTATVTATTTGISTPSTQQNDLITMVSNIVSSSNLTSDKTSVTAAPSTVGVVTTRSHIEEVIDDVAKGVSTTATTSTTTAIVTESAPSIIDATPLLSSSAGTTSTTTVTTKSTPIPNVLRDVMKTPCLTSSATATTPTTSTTVAATTTSETLNLFGSHRRSTSPLKTTLPTNVATAAPVAPIVVRPTTSKTSSNHKHSSTPKTDQPPPSRSPIVNFPHILAGESNPFAAAVAAAAAHHPNFAFSLFPPISGNPTSSAGTSPSNLLAPPIVSSSPPHVATRTSLSANNSSPSNSNHIVNTLLLNTIMSGQQNQQISSSTTQHTHEKVSKRDSGTKGQSTSSTSSSSNRSTPIQQAVPVPIALPIPSSSASSTSSVLTNNIISQAQASPLLGSLDPATVAAVAMRQQASPLQQFLGPDPVAPFRNMFADAAELYGTSSGLYPPQNMAYAAAAQQMLNVMSIAGNHHPSAAAFAELCATSDPYFHLNPPTNELSRDPYNVQWQGNLILKNDQAYVRTQLVAGSPQIARASMNYWNSDSLSSASSN
ncbi:unnamed protein product, partial [Adineta ricciae]